MCMYYIHRCVCIDVYVHRCVCIIYIDVYALCIYIHVNIIMFYKPFWI